MAACPLVIALVTGIAVRWNRARRSTPVALDALETRMTAGQREEAVIDNRSSPANR